MFNKSFYLNAKCLHKVIESNQLLSFQILSLDYDLKAGKRKELNGSSSPTEVALGDSIPNTAVSADFPSAYSFVGSDGLLLDSNAQNKFLENLSSKVLTPVDAGTAMSLVICTVTRSDGTSISFDVTRALVFAGGAPINVASY
jgi:hypothetical protein